jgi:hypothetical protein
VSAPPQVETIQGQPQAGRDDVDTASVRADCFAPISVSRDAYEAIRTFPTRFLTKSEHVNADDRVLQETVVFAVVEKVGPGAETAILLDPRKRASANQHRHRRTGDDRLAPSDLAGRSHLMGCN